MDDFLHDPRRVMAAAFNRVNKRRPGELEEPVRNVEARLLSSGVAAMDRMSPELATLHHVYRMALVILGKEDEWRASSAARSALYRLERAYDMAH